MGINADDKERSTYSFYRRASNGRDNILFVLNMTPMERKGFMVGVPFAGTYTHVLDSAKECFGGSGSNVPDKIKAVKGLCDYKDYSITFDLPAYGAEVFLFQDPAAKPVKEAKETKAKTKTQKEAALMVKDAEAQDKLICLALDVVRNTQQLQALSAHIKQLALPDSANIIAQEVIKLANIKTD